MLEQEFTNKDSRYFHRGVVSNNGYVDTSKTINDPGILKITSADERQHPRLEIGNSEIWYFDIIDKQSKCSFIVQFYFQTEPLKSGLGVYITIFTHTREHGIYNKTYRHPLDQLNINMWNSYYSGCSPGPHDISADPLFINLENGDFRLKSQSPCINVGSNTVPALPDTDRYGNSRIMYGVVDLGAYEWLDTTVEFVNIEPQLRFSLSQNFPNPFNPETIIMYNVPESSHVTITIYNILGQKIKKLVNEGKSPGTYSVKWDGTSDSGNRVTSGIYIYKMETDKGYVKLHNMMYLE